MTADARTREQLSDEVLLRRAGLGDQRAFEVLESRHRAALLAWCAARSRTAAEAEDLKQEVLLHAWRGAAGYRGTAAARTWLYRIVVNSAADLARRQSRRPRETGLPGPEDGRLPPAPVRPADSAVVETAELERLLALLPTAQRLVVVLIDLIGCTTAEAAAVCGIGEATARSRLSRGHRLLREQMRGEARAEQRAERTRSRGIAA
jgi:RNA polymerase sigma-70 factor (ECF subfamily)